MAIYIVFQCCKCNSKNRLHLYSCSTNQYDKYVKLCDHFNIRYSYTCKWGFFTLGWEIILEVKVQCRKCNSNYYNFGSNRYNSSYYENDMHHACCYNVFMVSVNGYNYANDGKGLLLQQKQKELEDAYKKQQQMKIQKEIERQQEIMRQEEEMRKQQEIQKQKELKIQNEKIKINNIMEKQKNEEKEIDQLYNCNIDYIDSELSHLFNSADMKINNELSFDVFQNMKENSTFQISKFEIK